MLAEKEIESLYKKVKPQKHPPKEYWAAQHEKHKEKRNAARRKYYREHEKGE